MSTYSLVLEAIEDYIEKCTKPHISALPYDRRTNDPTKLNERLEAIDENIKDLDKQISEEQKNQEELAMRLQSITEQNNEYEDTISEINSLEQDIQDYDDELTEQANESIDEILEQLNRFTDDDGNLPNNPSNSELVNYYYDDFRNLREMFAYSGFINGKDAKVLNNLADSLKQTLGDDKEVNDICTDLVNLADRHDINSKYNMTTASLMEARQSFGGTSEDFQKKIESNNKEYDHIGEQINDSIRKIDELEAKKIDYTEERKLTSDKL